MESIGSGTHTSAMSTTTYGDWLKRNRLSRRLTQGGLESQARLAEKYVSRIENRGTLPEEEVRQRIHDVFGTSDEDLVAEGILSRLTGPDGTAVYVRPDRSLGLPATALDQLRAMIKAGEIDEDGAQAIIEWWGQFKLLRG